MRNRPRKTRFGGVKRRKRSAGQTVSPVDRFLRFVERTGKRVRAAAFLLLEIVTVGSILVASVLLESSTITRMTKRSNFPPSACSLTATQRHSTRPSPCRPSRARSRFGSRAAAICPARDAKYGGFRRHPPSRSTPRFEATDQAAIRGCPPRGPCAHAWGIS